MPHALLQLDLSSDDAELAADALFACGAGGVEEQGSRRKARLIVYGGSAEELEPLRQALPAALAERGIAASSYRVTIRVEQSSDWERAYLEHLVAVEIAPGYWLRPTHDQRPLPEDARVLLYEPDVAFGDGAHVTTHLAARSVIERVATQPGCSVFDFGAGNGVLAILALLSGAGRASGLDIDPRSVTAAQRNAALNGCEARASFHLPGDAPVEPFDFVIANMEEPALLDSQQAIVSRVQRNRTGAVLAVTGFLADRVPIVSEAFAAHGLAPVRTVSEGDWALIELGNT
ncbi:MAG TPA: 50S ribosomal protein L11 methyltransferase [Polyangiaceae bacterium]|nr:50S ribosomal protein L11 methyltransferase [Polyangiaceae bacterium]